MIELKVPEVGESITEVVIANWLIAAGQAVRRDEPVAELESDKATIELPAPADGMLSQIMFPQGATVQVGQTIALLAEQAAGEFAAAAAVPPGAVPEPAITPAARRVLAEAKIAPAAVIGTGKGGLITKDDAITASLAQPAPVPIPQPSPAPVQPPAPAAVGSPAAVEPAGEEQLVPLSPIRRTIARRLLESQQTTAQLTTFNEVDMSAVIELRTRYKAGFLERYGVKLGFMSFFVKAAIEALKAYPSVNAEIRGNDIVYKDYYHIGIAVGGGKGLVVPVLRQADTLSFAQTERLIADFGERGAKNQLALEELSGGTFTVSNGGVYGSLLGTPILNPPQSGILGLHAIKERPVVVNGAVVARPMMYLALTYDHRLVDGRESVGFLTRIKEIIEDPSRLLLEI